MTFAWSGVAERIRGIIRDGHAALDDGQLASLAWIASRIGDHGVVLADEVGTGKTRIACALIDAVVRAGGRAAVVVPQGLMHQWVAEAGKLGASTPHVLATLKEFMRDTARTDADWNQYRPNADGPEWWLLSHSFRAPIVRSNWHWWRASLPSFVRMHLAPESKRSDGRTKFGKLQRRVDDTSEAAWGVNGMARIARDVAPVIRGIPELRKRIEEIPRLNVTTENNEPLLAAFTSDDGPRRVTEDIIGYWLGMFDLIVIDEAHKSRGALDDDERGTEATVLARLVDGILKQPAHGRRVCMTATPMELALDQWLGLLRRARCDLKDDIGHAAVDGLHGAAMAASVAPDEVSRIDELCKAARRFTEVLAPYVTRRRRDEDKRIREFGTAVGHRPGIAHPHRRLARIAIPWADAVGEGSPWLDVLFAAECMSHAARGLSNADTKDWPRAVRDAYTKLAEGHVSIDLANTSEVLRVPEPGVVDEFTRGKIARVAYWYRRLREARRRVAESVSDPSFDPDCDHPRIVRAVEEIESWTAQGEKVLVFGVFLQPLRNLRDVLNVREALRAADAGKPIAHAIHSDPRLMAIAMRQVKRMRGRFSEVLARATSPRAALIASHRAYKQIRPRVHENAMRSVRAWRADPKLLGGCTDAALDHELHEHLVSFALDQILAVESDVIKPTPSRVAELAGQFLDEYLMPLIDENDDDEAGAAEARQNALRRALVDDYDGRQSPHARLLQGSMKWETRRYLQAGFNRSGASPRVLIAQSQVGREGLNLHEACRVVIQFHAEWNPAILEQQIGRVDRKGSHWEALAHKWIDGGRIGEPNYIEVRQLIFEGTYDAFKWDRVARRQRVFDASLFGSLLPPDAWSRVPEDRVAALIAAAPSFKPEAISESVIRSASAKSRKSG